MPLSDAKIRTAGARAKAYKLTDGGGLFVLVKPNGSKLWQMKYRFPGPKGKPVHKLLSFGPYPTIGLADARQKRDDAKRLLLAGKDPGIEKRAAELTAAASATETFEKLAREWWDQNKAGWSEKHADAVLDSLVEHVFPKIGRLPAAEIKPPVILQEVLRPIERKGTIEKARRVRQRISAVFVFGIAAGVCSEDPAAVVLNALKKQVRGKQPAITDLDAARKMLADAEASPAHPVTKLANRFLALTVPRPGTLLETPWTEFDDLDELEPIWRVPPQRMKLRKEEKNNVLREHWIPLARQAVEILEVLREITGKLTYVFPNDRFSHKPMSENAIGYMLNRAGYHHKHVPHGWRSTFSTIMNERADRENRQGDRAIIDLMLAHVPKDRIESAYNRAAYMPRRREIAQEWADLLLRDAAPAKELLKGPKRINRP